MVRGDSPGSASMNSRPVLITVGAALVWCQIGGARAEEPHQPFVRMVELEIDPARVDPYQAALKEEIDTSVRDEPGVLAIYAVAERSDRSKVRLFEMYVDEAAYAAHIAAPQY